jgi:hypothetical protein
MLIPPTQWNEELTLITILKYYLYLSTTVEQQQQITKAPKTTSKTTEHSLVELKYTIRIQ